MGKVRCSLWQQFYCACGRCRGACGVAASVVAVAAAVVVVVVVVVAAVVVEVVVPIVWIMFMYWVCVQHCIHIVHIKLKTAFQTCPAKQIQSLAKLVAHDAAGSWRAAGQ